MDGSAPRAAMKPSIAKRPLMVSGPAPENAMASPKDTSFLAGGGGGGGGGVAEFADSVGAGSSAERTTTRPARLALVASTLLVGSVMKLF